MASPAQSDSLDANHDRLIISTAAVFSVLACLALILRLASKRVKKSALSCDDYLAIGSWILTLVQSALIAYGTHFTGLGRHDYAVPTEKVTMFLKGYYYLRLSQTTSLALAKLSALYLLHRIFITRSFRIAVRTLAAIVLCWWISSTSAFAFICTPIRANWDVSVPHHCGDKRAVLLSPPIPWILTDFAILIAPMFVIKNLRLPRSEKFGLIAVFMTGSLTCIVACYRFKTIFAIIAPKDVTWDAVDNAVWSIIETNVTVICICVITIQPAIHYLLSSSILLKTRDAWTRLLSSRSRGASYVRETSSPTPFDSDNNRQEGLLQAVHFDKRAKQEIDTLGYERSVPLRSVRVGHSASSLGDDAV